MRRAGAAIGTAEAGDRHRGPGKLQQIAHQIALAPTGHGPDLNHPTRGGQAVDVPVLSLVAAQVAADAGAQAARAVGAATVGVAARGEGRFAEPGNVEDQRRGQIDKQKLGAGVAGHPLIHRAVP